VPSLRRAAVCSAVFGLLCAPGPVRAGNDDELPVGNRAAITAGAVTATVDDSSAVFYNPAGLRRADRNTIDVSASAYGLRFYRSPGFISSESGASEAAATTEFVAIPTQIAYTRELGESVSLGLGYFVPRAGDVILREELFEQGPGYDASWALDLRSTSASYLVGAALAFEPSPRFRWGFSLLGTYLDATQSVTVFGGVNQNGVTERFSHLSALTTATQVGGSCGAGLQWDLSDTITLGAAVTCPVFEFYGSSETSLTISGAEPADDGSLDVYADTTNPPESELEIHFSQLGRYRLGIAYQSRTTIVSLDGDIQPGIRDKSAGVNRKLSWNARAGVSHRLSRTFLIGGGLFTDRAVEEIDPENLLQARGDFYGATLGVELDHQYGLAPNEASASIAIATVFALRYAHASGTLNAIQVDPNGSLLSSHERRLTAHEFALHVGSGIEF
jgi:hypothetical protein